MAAALEPTSSVPAFEKVSCARENAGRASSDAAVEPAAAERKWRRETSFWEPIHHLATMSAVQTANQREQTFTTDGYNILLTDLVVKNSKAERNPSHQLLLRPPSAGKNSSLFFNHGKLVCRQS